METRIKELREDSDRKQIEISKILGITQAQYSRIEKNEFQLDYEKLIKLAIFYNTSIDYLLRANKSKITISSCEFRGKKIRLVIKALFCAIKLFN